MTGRVVPLEWVRGDHPLRVIALGGLGEVGMNCLVLEQRGEALVVDCGVTFDGRGLGVDVVHPDFSALDGLRVAGLFLTHGHEDHIGAIPYFLRRFDVPVYGGRYALGLVRERAAEHEILEHVDMREVEPRRQVSVGSFEVEPVRETHSIADATSLAIRTDAGMVIHTGDFKFDESPPDGEAFDVARFEELSRDGVRLLMSDSTNIDAQGTSGSEAGVGEALDTLVAGAAQAVVVGIFASNVHRLRMLGEIARSRGRKIVPLGRSVGTHARVARSTRRATGPQAGTPLPPNGSMAERPRMARRAGARAPEANGARRRNWHARRGDGGAGPARARRSQGDRRGPRRPCGALEPRHPRQRDRRDARDGRPPAPGGRAAHVVVRIARFT